MSPKWHRTHRDQGGHVAVCAMTLPWETWKTSELTIFGLRWAQPKDTAQVEEALGGGQEVPKEDKTAERQHLRSQHLRRDPHQPKHQPHCAGIGSLGTGLALHPSYVWPQGSGTGPPWTCSPQALSPSPRGPAWTHSTLFPPRKVKLVLVIREQLEHSDVLL